MNMRDIVRVSTTDNREYWQGYLPGTFKNAKLFYKSIKVLGTDGDYVYGVTTLAKKTLLLRIASDDVEAASVRGSHSFWEIEKEFVANDAAGLGLN